MKVVSRVGHIPDPALISFLRRVARSIRVDRDPWYRLRPWIQCLPFPQQLSRQCLPIARAIPTVKFCLFLIPTVRLPFLRSSIVSEVSLVHSRWLYHYLLAIAAKKSKEPRVLGVIFPQSIDQLTFKRPDRGAGCWTYQEINASDAYTARGLSLLAECLMKDVCGELGRSDCQCYRWDHLCPSLVTPSELARITTC